MPRRLVALALALAGGFVLIQTVGLPGGPDARPGPARAGAAAGPEALAEYGKLPLSFVPNRGQTDSRVRYYAHAPGASFFFTRDEAVFALTKGEKGVVLRLALVGASPSLIEARRPGSGRVNYLSGSDASASQTGLPTYQEVIYSDLWPGIDLVFRGGAGRLKYEFHLAPGARVSDIRLRYGGADRLRLGRQGDLLVNTPLGVLRDTRPVSYQTGANGRAAVESRYVLGRSGGYGFGVGAGYDPARPLVIDPGLVYSTFLGGTDTDQARGIAIDAAGNAYIAGLTLSPDFPTTTGAFDTTLGGAEDAFVTKLNPAGSALVYSTYLGGSGVDFGLAVAIDPRGHAYVAGSTNSGDFPTTPGAFDTMPGGGFDGFVTKLSEDGSTLVYSTLLGGSAFDMVLGLAGITVDRNGHAYVAADTQSPDFPTTPGAFDTTFGGGGIDGFVTKVSEDGSSLVYSSYLGGAGADASADVAIDAQGHAYASGTTNSPDFPTSSGAFDAVPDPALDGFVSKVSPDGSALVYSTFLGGEAFDRGSALDVDAQGHAYVTGETFSAGFPTTPGAFDTAPGGGSDGFVTKLSENGSALVYSTFLGGAANENFPGIAGIAVDPRGQAHVTGRTDSADFPTTSDAFDSVLGGAIDAFVARLSADGSALAFSTFLGGSGFDLGFDLALDPRSHTYVTGGTGSPDFPTTPGAFDTALGGSDDAFVTRVDTR